MNRSRRRTSWLLAALAATALVPTAAAVDGVLEIHPACVAAGCFAGDAPGFPVEITESGSYRLTGNLAVTNAERTAITARVQDVSIDLNGFAILGSPPLRSTREAHLPPAAAPASRAHPSAQAWGSRPPTPASASVVAPSAAWAAAVSGSG